MDPPTPARKPLSAIAATVMRAAEMPPYWAANLFWPTVVIRKPAVVRAKMNQITTATATARKNPSG